MQKNQEKYEKTAFFEVVFWFLQVQMMLS